MFLSRNAYFRDLQDFLFFAACLAPGLESFRHRPHLIFSPKVSKFVKEIDDFIFPLERISLLLEASQIVQNIELLPPLGEVDFSVEGITVADVDKGQVLKDQSHVGYAGWTRSTEKRIELKFWASVIKPKV